MYCINNIVKQRTILLANYLQMRHLNFYFSVLTTILLFSFSSCGSKRDIVYFQNSDRVSGEMYYQDNSEFKTIIKPNDNLFISVTSFNPEAVKIFNTNQFNQAGNISATALDISGYIVDYKGNINFPLVGEVHVEGLTKNDAIQLLQREISKFAEDPVVNIRFLNYKVSVLGEVNRPGVYTVTDEKITIPQAIALAGDLTIYGERRNVLLTRIEKGETKFIQIDLTSADLFFSPYYYLRQEDVLYVSPNSTKAGSSTYNQNLPLLVSLISVTITAIALFVRNR